MHHRPLPHHRLLLPLLLCRLATPTTGDTVTAVELVPVRFGFVPFSLLRRTISKRMGNAAVVWMHFIISYYPLFRFVVADLFL